MLDFLGDVPELADHRTTATLLRPRPGEPGVRETSVGGPLLWPADEAWPVCRGPHEPAMDLRRHQDVVEERRLSDLRAERELTPEESARLSASAAEADDEFGPGHPVELIPLAQLRRADLPDFVGPAEADLAQVLWCPMDHPDRDYCPKVEVRYRREADVTAPLPPREGTGLVSEDYVPHPCATRPVQVTEYEHYKALPEDLLARIEDLDEEALDDYHDFATMRGFKVGGFPSWSMSDPEDMACEECAAPMRLLLVADGWEDGVEDRVPTRIQIGRGVNLNIWVCPTGLPHPTRTRMQH